jgi:hypothetical protein
MARSRATSTSLTGAALLALLLVAAPLCRGGVDLSVQLGAAVLAGLALELGAAVLASPHLSQSKEADQGEPSVLFPNGNDLAYP